MISSQGTKRLLGAKQHVFLWHSRSLDHKDPRDTGTVSVILRLKADKFHMPSLHQNNSLQSRFTVMLHLLLAGRNKDGGSTSRILQKRFSSAEYIHFLYCTKDLRFHCRRMVQLGPTIVPHNVNNKLVLGRLIHRYATGF